MKNSIVVVVALSFMLFPFQITLAEKDCGGKDELRHYSGHVARWLGIDPLADKYPDISPYAYCEYNPLMYVDPDGRVVFKSNEEFNEAAREAMHRYEPQETKNGKITYCNFGVQYILKQGGGEFFDGTANQMVRYLQDPQHGIELTSPEEAQYYADNGATVFACYLNKEGGHGHIAVIAPSEFSDESGDKVMLYNVGVKNDLLPQNEVFRKGKFTGYFILLTDKNKVDEQNSIGPFDLNEVVCWGSKQDMPKRNETVHIDAIKLNTSDCIKLLKDP